MHDSVETWVNGTLYVIDIDLTWRELFAQWDCKVETDVAAKIANAVTAILREAAEAGDVRKGHDAIIAASKAI